MGTEDPLGLAKILDSKTVEKVYDDLLHPILSELGQFGGEVVKGARLALTGSFRLLAKSPARFAEFITRTMRQVPEDRQIEATPEIAGPVLERLRYLDTDNPLAELYVNLLARAIDKERQDEAHPGYLRIIEQLSPHEAEVLYRLNKPWSSLRRPSPDKPWLDLIYRIVEVRGRGKRQTPMLGPEQFGCPDEDQATAYCFHLPPLPVRKGLWLGDDTSLAHLASLGLLEAEVGISLPNGFMECAMLSYRTLPRPLTVDVVRDYLATDFGRDFMKACIPSDGVPEFERRRVESQQREDE